MAAGNTAVDSGIPVPHFDIYGHQHHRKPTKDTAYLLKEDVRHPKWLEQPTGIRTRTELKEAQYRGRVPDLTYDFDGDGAVGATDHLVGRHFDRGNKGTLSDQERKDAKKALDQGFLDKFMTGLDSTGHVNRATTLQQRRGVILTHDNVAFQSGLTYPPGRDFDKVPAHQTRTALGMDRTAELKGAAQAIGERFAEACKPVREPQPHDARTLPRACSFNHIRERGEGFVRDSRAAGGLLAERTLVNPERDSKVVGGDWVEAPTFATRSQLLETRKEIMKQEGEDLRGKGDEVHVPHSVRRAEKSHKLFEYRRPGPEPKTFTSLKNQRRQDKIEYDLANFAYPTQAKYPKFSDRPDVPFWVDEDTAAQGAPTPTYHHEMIKTLSEPALKVTHIPFGSDEHTPVSTPAAGVAVRGGPSQDVGSNTVKRWSTDMLERGQGRNKPRLFDTIQPVRIGPRDLESLDLTSSMEPVRTAALRKRAEEQKKNSLNPRRSCLWTNASQFSATTDSQMTGPGGPGGQRGERSFESGVVKTRDMQTGVGGSAGADATKASGATVPAAGGQLATRSIASLPDKTIVHEHPREPRFYGSVRAPPMPGDTNISHMSMSSYAAVPTAATGTGIRSGGFQRLDWPPRGQGAGARGGSTTAPAKPAPEAAA